MRDREAKDFLVEQTTKQAALENVSLSDLEKRMMYFTETGECPEDPLALNDAFEAEYDTGEYETKISKLMHNAYHRTKKENPEASRRWEEAIKQLSKGDHYLLVLCHDGSATCNDGSPARPPYDSLKLIGYALLLVVSLTGIIIFFPLLFGRYGFHWRGQTTPMTREPVPLWAQRSLVALMVGAYVYWGVLPLISNRLRIPFPRLLSKVLGRRERTNTGK